MQVLVRYKQLNGDNRMVRSEVVSQDGDTLRVRHLDDHPHQPLREVKASDVVHVREVFGQGPQFGGVIRMHTDNRHALGYR